MLKHFLEAVHTTPAKAEKWFIPNRVYLGGKRNYDNNYVKDFPLFKAIIEEAGGKDVRLELVISKNDPQKREMKTVTFKAPESSINDIYTKLANDDRNIIPFKSKFFIQIVNYYTHKNVTPGIDTVR